MPHLSKFPLQVVRSQVLAELLLYQELHQQEQRIAQQWVQNMLQGNYESQTVQFDSPLLKSLMQLQQQLADLDKTERQHHWVIQGIAQFTSLLRQVQTLSMQEFSRLLLSKIIQYLGAVQGAFFVATLNTENEPVLEQTASYATTHQPNKHSIPVGNGVVGQVFLEGKMTVLECLPAHYLKISSGLGASSTAQVVLVPLQVNQQIEGIIEIASFSAFEAHHLEFLEKLGENIASALLLKKSNEETQRFIAEMNQKNQELQQKEEAMQQNLEEIRATQEQLERINEENYNMLQIIDSAVIMVEFMPSGKIAKANQNFLQLLSYTTETLPELSFEQLCSHEQAKTCWQQLIQKQDWQGEMQMQTAQGETVWLRTSFKPILNRHQKVVRILQIAYDITAQKQQAVTLAEQKQIIEQNEKLMLERTKNIQDKAYERIKKLKEDFKTQLEAKEQEIARLHERLKELEKMRA